MKKGVLLFEKDVLNAVNECVKIKVAEGFYTIETNELLKEKKKVKRVEVRVK